MDLLKDFNENAKTEISYDVLQVVNNYKKDFYSLKLDHIEKEIQSQKNKAKNAFDRGLKNQSEKLS